MSRRPVSTFPLSQDQINSLINAGYTIASDIRKVQPARLASDLSCSLDDALNILHQCQQVVKENHPNSSHSRTNTNQNTANNNGNRVNNSNNISSSSGKRKGASALEMLEKARKRPGIITFSPEIDKQLFSGSGGVPIGQMTEFCGAPGLGKTQICMQLACNVTIPNAMGGVEGECVYIDTEGSFMVDRVHQIATSLESHLRKNVSAVSNKRGSSDSSKGSGRKKMAVPCVSDILSKIYCFRVHDVTEQLATLKILPEFIVNHPKVKLIVLDSVAFHFRHDFTDMAKRSRALSQLAQDLNKIASDYNLSVVVTNHVTTRMGNKSNSNNNSSSSGGGDGSGGGTGGGESSGAYLAPALGESWSHAATNRVELFWNKSQRTARLTKSPSLSLRSVPYQIVAAGVRGVSYRSDRSASRSNDEQNKKQRVL